jgi:hypothetical protein
MSLKIGYGFEETTCIKIEDKSRRADPGHRGPDPVLGGSSDSTAATGCLFA